ncbi:MAG: hypothetical protein ACYTHJ_04440 [Planctomycetota bacterium]|jgi:hypothetical protein
MFRGIVTIFLLVNPLVPALRAEQPVRKPPVQCCCCKVGRCNCGCETSFPKSSRDHNGSDRDRDNGNGKGMCGCDTVPMDMPRVGHHDLEPIKLASGCEAARRELPIIPGDGRWKGHWPHGPPRDCCYLSTTILLI